MDSNDKEVDGGDATMDSNDKEVDGGDAKMDGGDDDDCKGFDKGDADWGDRRVKNFLSLATSLFGSDFHRDLGTLRRSGVL